MAQLALTVVGFAVGGPLGAAIGSAVGGYIDSNFLFPTKVEGPRLSDLSVSASTYGNAIPLAYGPSNRLATNLIWSSGLIEKKTTKKQGKGGGAKVTTYSYSAHIACAIAAGPCVSVKRIWGDSKLLYQASDPATRPIDGLVFLFKGISTTNIKKRFTSMTFYPGNGTQGIDPLIESYLGVGNTPAFRHTCYIVLQGLQLADFGNRIPNIEVELEAHTDITVQGIIQDIATRCNIPLLDVITSGNLHTQQVDGYVIGRVMDGVQALSPLSTVYNFDPFEYAGQLYFAQRGGSVRTVMEIGQLGAFDASGSQALGEPPDPLKVDRLSDLSMPKQITISFKDKDRDHQVGSQAARRLIGNAQNNIVHDLAVVLDATDARRIAERLLFEAWTGKTSVEVTVTDKYLYVRPGYTVTLPIAGRNIPFRVVKVVRGFNGVIQWSLIRQYTEVYSPTAPGSFASWTGQTVPDYGLTLATMLDIPILQTADDNTGFYYVLAGDTDGWPGGVLMRSIDGATTYDIVQEAPFSGMMGAVTGTPLPTGPTDFIDEANTLTVEMLMEDMELSGVEDVSFYAGYNAAYVGPANGFGGEIIQYRYATLMATKTYELTGLLRGRMGTEHAVSTHAADDIFVPLSAGFLNRPNFGADDLNKLRDYKAVTLFTELADAANQQFTNTGVGKKPLSPVHVTGTRDGSNNLTLAWIRRSRHAQPGLGNGPVPLGEATEAYEIDIIVGGNPVRTLTSTTPTVEYSAANQTTDGITPGNPVTAKIYQMSDIVGRGYPATATV